MATASEIARMCSDDRGGGGPPLTDAELQACGVHEDSDCSTTVTNDKTLVASMTFHKTADEIIKAVEKKKEAIRRVFKMMQYAEKVDLCFLVDRTWSMRDYIARVKTVIKTWSERLKANYTHLKLRVAFVGYTDFDYPESTRTTRMDFTEDIENFCSYVDAIVVPDKAGKDTCEDVFGGLEVVTKLQWQENGTNVLIHFADAPCHGKQYYNEALSDQFPDGDPRDRDLNGIMSKLYKHKIDYHFGYISERVTEKMIEEFDKVLLEHGDRDKTIRTFNATTPDLIDEAVYRSISSSISSSLEKMSATGNPKANICRFTIMKRIPDWDSDKVERLSVKMSMPAGETAEWPTIPAEIKLAKEPFAKGALRLAYHAYIPAQKRHIVMKKFLFFSTDKEYTCRKRFLEATVTQGTAASYAEKFNKARPPGVGVEIAVVKCGIIECPEDSSGVRRYYTYEPFIDGDYIKFNSNAGYVAPTANPVNDTCQAFSHFTWIESGKEIVVCDIQGVKRQHKLLLTDPAIHSKSILEFGSTNNGVKGIRHFFRSHRCNEICTKMILEKSRHQH